MSRPHAGAHALAGAVIGFAIATLAAIALALIALRVAP